MVNDAGRRDKCELTKVPAAAAIPSAQGNVAINARIGFVGGNHNRLLECKRCIEYCGIRVAMKCDDTHRTPNGEGTIQIITDAEERNRGSQR